MTQPGHKCPGWEVSVSVTTPMIAEHVATRFDLSRRINRDRCDDSCEPCDRQQGAIDGGGFLTLNP